MTDAPTSDTGIATIEPLRPSPADLPAYEPYKPVDPPKTPEEARAQYDKLSANKDWRERVLRGEHGPLNELKAINEKLSSEEKVDRAIEGMLPYGVNEIHTPDEPSSEAIRATVAELQSLGILRPETIKEAFTADRSYSREIMQMAQVRYNERTSDKEFVAKYLAGDVAARREMTLLAIIMSGNIAAK